MKKPKVAFVVQRCGAEVNGGAEKLCFDTALKMQKYWDIEVLASCAIDYITWENHYEPGEYVEQGLTIKRFPVDYPRDIKKFGAYFEKIYPRRSFISERKYDKLMRLCGPLSTSLLKYIRKNKDNYDLFVFVTISYAHAYFGIPLVADKAFIIPTTHDETIMHFPFMRKRFEMAQFNFFLTPEEKFLVERLYPETQIKGDVLGTGLDLPKSVSENRFRKKFKITSDYILYVGRVDEGKGIPALFKYFREFKKRNSGSLKLLLTGKATMKIPRSDDIVHLGFISEEDKYDAIAGCKFLVNPSKHESLSLVLLEAWTLKKPVLVTYKSDVMRGQCMRSSGGLWFRDFFDFEQCIGALMDKDINAVLGQNGYNYVLKNYTWNVVTKKLNNIYENVIYRST